jgi:hypothetical protein
MKQGASPRRRLAEVLDEAVLHDDLAEFQAKDAADRDRELAEMGYDDARMQALVEAARAQAAAAPVQKARASGEVVDLRKAREARRTRWVPLLAAAGVLLGVGGAATRWAATTMPVATVTYPTEVAGPPREELARAWTDLALHKCGMHYWGECRDHLDEAQKLWPQNEDRAEVKAARKAIEDAGTPKAPDPSQELRVKPGLAPGERPLQRTP